MLQQRVAQISSLKQLFPYCREVSPNAVYEIPVVLSPHPNQLILNIIATLGPTFPQAPPTLTVQPIMRHRYIDQNTGSINPSIHPFLSQWNPQNPLGKLVFDITQKFLSEKPSLVAGSSMPYPTTTSYASPSTIPTSMHTMVSPAVQQKPEVPIPDSKIQPLKTQMSNYSANVNFTTQCGLGSKSASEIDALVNANSSELENLVKQMDSYKKVKECEVNAEQELSKRSISNVELVEKVSSLENTNAEKRKMKDELAIQLKALQDTQSSIKNEFSSKNLVKMLSESSQKDDKASEKLADKYKKDNIDTKEFFEKYRELRYSYHFKLVKKQMLAESRQ